MQLSKIDDTLQVYRENKVILFGASSAGINAKRLLEKHNIQIAFFCDNDKNKWGTVLEGIQIISPEELDAYLSKHTLIQVTSDYSKDIVVQLKQMGIYCYISYEEYKERISGLVKYHFFSKYNYLKEIFMQKAVIFDHIDTRDERGLWEYLAELDYLGENIFYFLCLPPKTGDWTLNASLHHLNKKFINLWHSFHHMLPELKEFLKNKTVKIVTAVREPVSQNISEFFQMCNCFWDTPEYWEKGGDVQFLFDEFLAHELPELFSKGAERRELCYFEAYKKAERLEYMIQHFFERQFEPFSGIDIYQYPFDKEKGYSIITEGNVQIFIYQLEKLNYLKKELADFLGVKKLELINDNTGDLKWYADAYSDAKKNLKLRREYLEWCCSGKFMNHFYNKKDIQAVYDKWKGCINS